MKKSRIRLSVVKISPRRVKLFCSLLIYFYDQWNYAQRRMRVQGDDVFSGEQGKPYIHPISLSNIYISLKISQPLKPLVKVAAAVFFKQEFRGSNLTRKCSGWAVLREPRLNNQLLRLLPDMFELNRTFILDARNAVMGENNTVNATFKFENARQAELFTVLINSINHTETPDAE